MGTTLVHLADLFTKAEHPLAIAGGSALGGANGLAVAQLTLALNALVDNLGQTGGVSIAATPDFTSTMRDMKNLVDRMKAGELQAIFIHGANPVFELPSSLGFTEALKNVSHVISFSSYQDETARLSDYILPDHTPLESFGYQSALTGSDRPVLSSLQPVVAPLYETRATADVLLAAVKNYGSTLAERLPFTDEVDFIQQGLSSIIDTPNGIYQAEEVKTFWAKWLQNGGWWTTEPVLKAPDALTVMEVPVTVKPAAEPPSGYHLNLVVYATNLGDGSGANRPWLQETPNPLTTAMWGSWVEINPDTARELGIEDDDIVRITSSVGEVEAPAYLYPGIRLDTIAIPFGQGHSMLGRYAQERGCNPMKLLEVTLNEAGEIAFGVTYVKVTKTGSRKHLARAESRHGIYGEKE
jgi:anaerobic selenocysteine-containing dehydrogenase